MSGEGSSWPSTDHYTAAEVLALAQAKIAELEAERDAALKRCDKLDAFITYIESPALKAWRALDSFDAAQLLDRMRAEAGRRTGYNDDKGAAAWTAAAAALEALAEPRP